jgi:hypothetical protein
MSHESIALALGISRMTLNKYFAHELSVGAFERRMEVMSAMHKAAKGGNVTAQKAYMQIAPPIAAPDAGTQKDEQPAKPLGKKEQLAAEAKVAQLGTEWDSLLHHPNSIQ